MSDNTPETVSLLGREIIMARWALLGQWWCIRVDATAEEQAELIRRIKENMQFERCPDEWVADRLYGGFRCDHKDRRHVYFAAGEYSHIEAGNNHFWANDAEHRQDTWVTLLEHDNAGNALLDGPFTSDAPRVTV